MSETLKGKISGFGCSVDEVFTPLGCYAAYVGSCLPTGCPETSANN
jgi:hypothetical protein